MKDETPDRRDAFKICSSTVLFKRCCRMRPSLCPVNIAEIFSEHICFSRACKFCRRHLKCRGCPDDIFNFLNKIIEGEDLVTVLRRFFASGWKGFYTGDGRRSLPVPWSGRGGPDLAFSPAEKRNLPKVPCC